MSEKGRGELQLFMSRPEGCEQTGRLRNSECAQLTKYIRYKNVQHCRVMEYSTRMQAQGVATASVRGRVFPLLRQTHPMLPRVRWQSTRTARLYVDEDVAALASIVSTPAPERHIRSLAASVATARMPFSVNQNWQQVESAASWKSCSLTGLRRPFRGVRGSWSFRLHGGLPRGVAVFCDRRPMLSCICTAARRIPRRPSNLTFVAVPH